MQETVTVKGIRMSYLRFGSGEKAFVLLPGLSVEKATKQAKAMERRYSAIAETHTVYLFDRREPMPDGYSIHHMAEDTLAVMERLGIEKPCLCGLSQGGMIALDMAVCHPDYPASLIVCSGSAYLNAPLREALGVWAAAAESGDSHALNLAFVERLFSDRLLKKGGAALAALMPEYSEEILRRFLRAVDSFRGFDLRADLPKILCPAYVIGATHDRVMGSDAAAELAGLLGCGSYIYPDYAHAVYDEAPDFGKLLARILQEGADHEL